MTDIFTKQKRSWVMSRIRSKNTAPERIVRSFLHRRGFRFRLHRKDLPGKPDIVLSRHRTVVFVHGCFWHGHDCKAGASPQTRREFWQAKIAGNAARDKVVAARLRKLGWRVLTVWECEVSRVPRIEALLRKRA